MKTRNTLDTSICPTTRDRARSVFGNMSPNPVVVIVVTLK